MFADRDSGSACGWRRRSPTVADDCPTKINHGKVRQGPVAASKATWRACDRRCCSMPPSSGRTRRRGRRRGDRPALAPTRDSPGRGGFRRPGSLGVRPPPGSASRDRRHRGRNPEPDRPCSTPDGRSQRCAGRKAGRSPAHAPAASQSTPRSTTCPHHPAPPMIELWTTTAPRGPPPPSFTAGTAFDVYSRFSGPPSVGRRRPLLDLTPVVRGALEGRPRRQARARRTPPRRCGVLVAVVRVSGTR